MPTLEHFELPADDLNRATEFHKSVFDWELERFPNPENPDKDYWFVKTKDQKGNVGISGGLMKRQSADHNFTNYITVNSSNKYSAKITEKGGKILVPKSEIHNMGYYEIFLDTKGNMLGLYEEKTT